MLKSPQTIQFSIVSGNSSYSFCQNPVLSEMWLGAYIFNKPQDVFPLETNNHYARPSTTVVVCITLSDQDLR